ncbi:hypothetical protein CDL15_Pgr009388 [Punica granatum]|uniref:Uncharacterized protein n=1 Tax=Punica granatum TaxID=22663 RepID=A0A218WV53_PUNGR|nr:hypothetical protein CDL15_Pgr009388 [Punica granatum]
MHERGGSVNLRCRKTRQGCKSHERAGSANLRCKNVSLHGLAGPARLQEARGRWLGKLAVQENPARLQEARARWLGDLAVQESKLARVTRPGKVARGERSGSANLRCRKVISHGLADPARSKEARAMWLGELTVQESKFARDSRPGKTRQGCKWHERGGSANLRRRKVSSHGLAYPAREQEVRGRCLGELAVQESKLARVSRPGKVARGTSEQARRTCGAGM